nr:hypothetical protein [Tanacetum cinerariifolium]
MSDSKDSIITYTAVSSPYGGLLDIGSPGIDGPPVMPEDPYAYVVAAFQAPPSPDYVSGPEYPPSPKFVLEPVYLKFMPAEDDIQPAEEQPLHVVASPTTKSRGYIDESDPEEDLVDYPADGGDEGDDEDESSDDDEDDDIDIEGDEEDEYLAPADSTAVALPAIDQAPSAEETEPFETDESAATPPLHPAYRVTVRMSIRPQTPISLPSDIEIARLMAIPTPPPSPLSPLSSPLPQIPSLPLPLLSPPPTDPTYKEAPLGYRVARIRWRAKRVEIPEALCTTHTGTYELGESSAATTARLKEPVRDDLYRFVYTVERGEGSTPAVREVGASRTAKTQSIDASDAARSGVISLRGDQGVAGSTPQATGTVHTGTNCTEVMLESADCSSRMHSDLRDRQSPSTARDCIDLLFLFSYHKKMAPKRTTRANLTTTTTTTTTYVTDAQLEALIKQGVARALAARDPDRNTNGNDNHNSGTGARRTERVTRECTYPDFMTCKPLNFKGTEGVVELTQWFEKMETVFRISNCFVENQIKFSTCTLLGSALTW